MSNRSSKNLAAGRGQSFNSTFSARPRLIGKVARRILRNAGHWPSSGDEYVDKKDVLEAIERHRRDLRS